MGIKTELEPGTVFLHIEEYEALRLCDYDMLNHHQASVIMDVSRPTLTRIYARARQKIAEALVLGKQIIIEGGRSISTVNGSHVKHADAILTIRISSEEIKECPLCKSNDITNYEEIQ